MGMGNSVPSPKMWTLGGDIAFSLQSFNKIFFIWNRVLWCSVSGISDRTVETLSEWFLPPTKEEGYVLPVFVCLSVCLWARLLKNACMDLDEMLRVDICRDIDELINFWARSGLLETTCMSCHGQIEDSQIEHSPLTAAPRAWSVEPTADLS